jgi:hypothetical protein
MKIGFAFYGITHGTDKKTGYTRDFRECWDNIQTLLIDPFKELGHETINYASTYPFGDLEVRDEFYRLVAPKKVIYPDFEGSNAFTAKSALHEVLIGEELNAVIFTRFDILFHDKIAFHTQIDYNKVNVLFPEDPNWWASHRFVCDCFYIWNHKFSPLVKDAMRETYGWPRGTEYPDTHGILNFLVPKIGTENVNFLDTECQISNVNKYYTLCRPDVPDHPMKHSYVKAKYG